MDTEIAAPREDTATHRRIGAILGEARIAAGLELNEIARDTRVPARHLAAIEKDAHDSLPALPYAIGFVKAFARAVGVDAEAAAAQFRAETDKTAHVPVAPPMAPLDERRLPPRGLLTASIVGVLVIVGAVIAYSAGMLDGAVPPAPAPATAVVAPEPARPAAVTAPAAAVVAAPVATAPAGTGTATQPPATMPPVGTVAPGPGRVTLTANDDVWYRISGVDPATGKLATVKTGVLAKGETYAVPATPGLKLWTGRAGALAVAVDGRALPPLGGPVETVKNLSLDPAALLARAAAPVAAAPARP